MGRPKGSKDKEPRARRISMRPSIPHAPTPAEPSLRDAHASAAPVTPPPSHAPQAPQPPRLLGVTPEAAVPPFRGMLRLLDEVEEALATAGHALGPHLKAAELERDVRAHLIQLGTQILDRHGSGAPLLDDFLLQHVDETMRLRNSARAAKEAALARDVQRTPG